MRYDLPLSQVQTYKNVFDSLDLLGSGKIDFYDMKQVFLDAGHDGSSKHVKEVFKSLEGDVTKGINFKDFMGMLTDNSLFLGNELGEFRRLILSLAVSEWNSLTSIRKREALMQTRNWLLNVEIGCLDKQCSR